MSHCSSRNKTTTSKKIVGTCLLSRREGRNKNHCDKCQTNAFRKFKVMVKSVTSQVGDVAGIDKTKEGGHRLKWDVPHLSSAAPVESNDANSVLFVAVP